MKFIKNAGGWSYESICGRFKIINLAKADRDEEMAKGWRLIDNKDDDVVGDFDTLKAAKQSAIDVVDWEQMAA